MEETLGQRLYKLRKERELSQNQVADLFGVDRSAVSLYESNERQPSVDLLIKMASVYHVSADYLLGVGKRTDFDMRGLTDAEIQAFSLLINHLSQKNGNQKQ